jgi:hypothetical protein
MKHIVKSIEGIEFVVDSDVRSCGYDIQFAKARPAAELEAHGDFTRVRDPQERIWNPPTHATQLSPPKARPKLTLIRGGKS